MLNLTKVIIPLIAISELELYWKNPETGVILKENHPSQLVRLTKYWKSIESSNEEIKKYRRFNPKKRAIASAQNQSAWSAAFICYVYRTAGINLVDGFEYSRRHLTYIAKAIDLYRKKSQQTDNLSDSFMFYDKSEFSNNTTISLFDSISVSDLICLNRKRKNGIFTNHNMNSLSRFKNLEKVKDVSHCDIVVKKYQDSGKNFLVAIGGNVSHTVAKKIFEVKDDKVFLITNGKRRASHYFGFVQI